MKLWSGRFIKTTDNKTDEFHSSILFDKRLYRQDIQGSIAHAQMLAKQQIISREEGDIICRALAEILQKIEQGEVEFDLAAEDIHMNIEKILIDSIGDTGKKLHTGRSRNDQTALDMRMYVKDEIETIKGLLVALIKVLLKLAVENTETIMPGYTHLQKAQPITFAHHMLAYIEMFRRDYERLEDAFKRTDVMPLGAAALATTTYNLDRHFVCEKLGFREISRNSLDAVSDRDFCIEFLGALSITMMHLSRFCEEIILWCSNEFSFIELDDSYTTGSSIMPQKKNPDMAELIRGKTGRVYGNLMSLLTVMKGLPLAYNKDMQEDKESIFDGADTLRTCLVVFTDMISSMSIKKENMRKGAKSGFINATDAADWLVKKGIPFRDAHEILGKLVLYSIQQNKSLEDLTIEDYQSVSETFDESIYESINLENCVNARKIWGGPAKKVVEQVIAEHKHFIAKLESLGT